MNITKLIPYLMNKIAKVEKGLSTIDFTPYQAKNEKDQSNGYLGLDINKKILSNKFLIPKKKLAFISDTALLTPSTSIWDNPTQGGSGTYLLSGLANSVKIKSGNTTLFYAPTLTLAPSAMGYIAIIANRAVINIASPFKIFCEIKLSSLKTSIKQNTLSVGIGSYIGQNGLYNGSGLIITIDPTVNGGNFRYGKVLSGVTTLSNASNTISAETLTSFIIEYDKLTEVANFYIDYQLIGTMTSINIPNNTNLREAVGFYTNDLTDTTIKRVSIFSNNIEFDLEG